MKKIILALLVVIMAMAPVMADENWVGVDLGVPFGFNFREHSTTTTIGLDATVRTAFYLDREETMGIGAALGFDFKLASKVEDLDFQSVNDNNFTLSPAVSFQYRLELGRDMDLRLGAGLMYSHTFGYSGGNDVFSSSGFAGGGLSEHAVEKRLERHIAAVDVVGDEMFLHEIGRGGFCINVACGNAPFLSEQINDLTELFKAQLKGCHVGQKPFWHGHGAA